MHTILTTKDLRALRDAATNVFAPGVHASCEGLQRLQSRGYVASTTDSAFDGHMDVTEADYRHCERAGLTVHRPMASWRRKAVA